MIAYRFSILALSISATTFVGAAQAQSAGGVAAARAVPQAAHLIDFDGVEAPAIFAETKALASLGGVKFDGSSVFTKDGGAIIENVLNPFGVSGYSAPNVLGFDCNESGFDGGRARLPEIITFPKVVRNVSIRAGSGVDAGKTLKLFGIGPGGVQVKSITLAPALAALRFNKPLQRLLISSETDACVFVLDDLRWMD